MMKQEARLSRVLIRKAVECLANILQQFKGTTELLPHKKMLLLPGGLGLVWNGNSLRKTDCFSC